MGRPIDKLPRLEAYQCLEKKCEHEWRQPLPSQGEGVFCPACKNLYVEWLSWDCAEVVLNRDIEKRSYWESLRGTVKIRVRKATTT